MLCFFANKLQDIHEHQQQLGSMEISGWNFSSSSISIVWPPERVARWYAQIRWKMSISLSIKPIRRDQHLAKSAKSRLNCIFTRFLCEFARLLTRETAVVCGLNVKTINLCLSICTRHVSGASHFCSCKVVKISRVWEPKNSERWFGWFSIIVEKSWKRKLSFIDLYTIMILRNSDLKFGCLIMVILWAARWSEWKTRRNLQLLG